MKPFSKNILLLLIMLCIKHSIAQVGITADSIDNTVDFVPDSIKQDLIAQPTLPSPIGEEPGLMSTPDTLKPTLKLLDTIATRSTIPSLSPLKEITFDSLLQMEKVPEGRMRLERGRAEVKKTDTVYLLEIAKPSITQSNITFDVGQVFSTFKFIDNQGNKENNFTHNIGGRFSLGYQYALKNGLFVHANLGMRKAGASLIYGGLNLNWNIQYADANIGLGYMLNKKRIKPYFSVSPYYAYMLKGNQTIATDDYNIKQNKLMKETDFGLSFSPGIKIALSNYVGIYAAYIYTFGLQNLETSTNQQSYNRGFSFNLGVAVTIENLRPAGPTVLPQKGHKVQNYLKNK